MSAESHALDDAFVEGVRFEFLAAPIRILREDRGVVGVQVQRMSRGEPDHIGRRRPVAVPGEIFTLEADTVLAAVSQEPSWRGFGQAADGRAGSRNRAATGSRA